MRPLPSHVYLWHRIVDFPTMHVNVRGRCNLGLHSYSKQMPFLTNELSTLNCYIDLVTWISEDLEEISETCISKSVIK